jgi:hypothetical protein
VRLRRRTGCGSGRAGPLGGDGGRRARPVRWRGRRRGAILRVPAFDLVLDGGVGAGGADGRAGADAPVGGWRVRWRLRGRRGRRGRRRWGGGFIYGDIGMYTAYVHVSIYKYLYICSCANVRLYLYV